VAGELAGEEKRKFIKFQKNGLKSIKLLKQTMGALNENIKSMMTDMDSISLQTSQANLQSSAKESYISGGLLKTQNRLSSSI
jgi:hypothetical protein